ncbi:MAG: double-strand break repair helicase AddA [Hyphomicrobiaceae bacterium]
MSTVSPKPSADLAGTRKAQSDAADPAASAWVAANAGTGKTHVLTTRVLRLLVAGTKPERILCLTYTKAAATEMSQRVFDRLAKWVTLDEAGIARELRDLNSRPPTADEVGRARDLFTVAIETPGGLKVQTIHAFCERLLQRFPLEAGIPPKFAILDDETGLALRTEAIEDVLNEASRENSGALGQALSTVIAWAVDDGFDALLADALGKRDWLEAAARLGSTEDDERAGAEQLYRQAMGLSAQADLATTEAALAGCLSDAELAHVATALAGGGKTDAKFAAAFTAARATADRRGRIEALKSVFLKADDEPRQSMASKAVKTAQPDVDALLSRKQAVFATHYEERGKLTVLAANMALLRLAVAVLQRYGELKQRRAALDFDDLIRRTANLLSLSAQAQWVLYKLDGGLDHILVDEAQDTSPAQWRIVEALAAEFFTGDGTQDAGTRTLFAVGDEKQSIYGFQGAAPKKFAEMGTRFEQMAQAAGQAWRRVPLTLSFRTTVPVLAAVDRVFADAALAAQVSASGEVIQHAANRIGAAGHVEIWPTEQPDDVEEADVWSPLAESAVASPVVRLAERIAGTIERWLAQGEMLKSENRPVRAGDILILVRRRRPFAEAMVAALKARQIPVAGADRIRLAEQTAMQDLMALADFLLLPEDDLALATVLKSPLFDLDDDDLMAIAPARPGALWSALIRAVDKGPRFAAAVVLLKRWRSRSDLLPPFEFFVEILDRDGMRARLLSRLGAEAADPIDEFLRLALTYDEGAPPSLEGFIAALRASNREIKRDMEHGRDEVRVMTVHGAKGLEAPIVFLPDTCTTSSGARPGGLLMLEGLPRQIDVPAPMLWPVKGSKALDIVKVAREETKERDAAERNRLLYVALTRPRDRLYVAGFEGTKGREKGCWYDLIAQGLEGLLQVTHDAEGREVRSLVSPQSAPAETPRGSGRTIIEAVPLPDWATRPAPREAGLVVPLAPSRLAPLESDEEGDPVERPKVAATQRTDEPAPLPPAAQADGQRFLRGTITHALLQHLPGRDPGTWAAAAERFVAARGAELNPKSRASIVAETLAVLNDTAFAPIFGPGSRAEVPIVAELAPPQGQGQILRVTGQIDRLVVLDTHVLIVDFKTNRPPPAEAEAVAEAYLLQLAAYRLAVAQIFPGKAVKSALLWTDGPRLMAMPDAMLDAAATRLFALERGNPAT